MYVYWYYYIKPKDYEKAKLCYMDAERFIVYIKTDKKAKDTKKCVIKRRLNSKNYKNCLQANQFENKTNYLEKNLA